jgi:hypothetical protein
MVLLGVEAQVEPHFGPFWRRLILTQDSALLAPDIPYSRKSFWTHLIEPLGDVGLVDLRFGLFGGSVSVGAR